NPFWYDELKKTLKGLEPLALQYIAGTPVKSQRWSVKIFLELISGYKELQELFPGFEIIPNISMDEETTLVMKLKPSEPVIRHVWIKVRSKTLPALLLEQVKYAVAAESDLLVGMPVEYVKEASKDIVEDAPRRFAESPLAQALGLNFEVNFRAARESVLQIVVESSRFRGFVKGKVSIGKEDRNPDIEFHLGAFLGGRTEVFTEFNFFPGPIDLQANLGVGRRFSPVVYAAVGKNVTDGINRVWMNYYLSEDVVVSWEKGIVETEEEDIEGSVLFQVHDFFSVELTTDFHKDIWFRFNVHL
ncbi:MAG: hypothetical protein AB1546_08180, partial [bacterium]